MNNNILFEHFFESLNNVKEIYFLWRVENILKEHLILTF